MSYSSIVKNSKETTKYNKYSCDICALCKRGKPWLMYITRHGDKSNICSYLCYSKTNDVKMKNILNKEDFNEIRPHIENKNEIKFLDQDDLDQLDNNQYSTYMDELYEKCLLNPEKYYAYIRSLDDNMEYCSDSSEDYTDDLYVNSD